MKTSVVGADFHHPIRLRDKKKQSLSLNIQPSISHSQKLPKTMLYPSLPLVLIAFTSLVQAGPQLKRHATFTGVASFNDFKAQVTLPNISRKTFFWYICSTENFFFFKQGKTVCGPLTASTNPQERFPFPLFFGGGGGNHLSFDFPLMSRVQRQPKTLRRRFR